MWSYSAPTSLNLDEFELEPGSRFATALSWKVETESPQGIKCVHENLCRPYGTRVHFPLDPALQGWAMIFRPPGLAGGRISRCSPTAISKMSSHAHAKARIP